MLHRNGTPPDATLDKAPPPVPPRTAFLPERPVDSPRALLYHLARRQLLGLPLIRWLYLLLCLTPLLMTLLLPLPWSFVGGLGPLLLIGLWLWEWSARKQGYVRFTPLPAPPVTPKPLPPKAKLPVYVSGLLAVENKARPFAAVPGFYRTFNTREHALLCRVRAQGITGLGAWPPDEEGLWYAFFTADHVHSVRTGIIAFDRTPMAGFAVDYTPPQPLDGKRRRRPQRQTLYVAFPQPEDFQTALADLAVDPPTRAAAPIADPQDDTP